MVMPPIIQLPSPIMACIMAAAPVHGRAGGRKQVGQYPENVARMSREQVGAEHRHGERDQQARHGADESGGLALGVLGGRWPRPRSFSGNATSRSIPVRTAFLA